MRLIHIFVVATLGVLLPSRSFSQSPAASQGSLRYDGFYTDAGPADTLRLTHYLRFYPDGTVLGASSIETRGEIVRWLNRENGAYSGEYHLRGGTISLL